MEFVVENVGRRDEVWAHGIGDHSLNGYERNVLLHNRGDGGFVDVGYLTASNRIEDGRAVAVADFDRDGQLDLLLQNFSSKVVLLMGLDAPGNWLQIELEGTTSNRDAVGAVVTIETESGRQTRQVSRGNGFLACSSPVLHFGLATATAVERVEVRWPNGHRQILTNIDANQRLAVRENSAGGGWGDTYRAFRDTSRWAFGIPNRASHR
jgi:hypothetical protein